MHVRRCWCVGSDCVFLSISVRVCLLVCLWVCLSVCLPFIVSVCLLSRLFHLLQEDHVHINAGGPTTCLSACLFVCLIVCLSVCLSACQCECLLSCPHHRHPLQDDCVHVHRCWCNKATGASRVYSGNFIKFNHNKMATSFCLTPPTCFSDSVLLAVLILSLCAY